jgi:hypothetical protein
MGRSYWFECSKCGYRAKVSGRAEGGVFFAVQTIVCRDCKELYDAVTRVKIPDGARAKPAGAGPGLAKPWSAKHPPTFMSALNRLTVTGERQFRWLQFPLRCPAHSFHRVQPWNAPDKCPRCGVYLERASLPFRIWD